MPEREPVAGEAAANAFLADPPRFLPYSALFGGLCLSLSALAAALGNEWQGWVFQAVNVSYRAPDFGVNEIKRFLISDF